MMTFARLLVMGSMGVLGALHTGCGGEATLEVEKKSQPGQPETTVVRFRVRSTFLEPDSISPNPEIVLESYPNNRVLFRCSTLTPRPGWDSVVPVEVPAGQHYKLNVSAGDWSRTFDVVTARLSSLPAGTSLLECPGMMEAIVLAARENAGSPLQVRVSSGWLLERAVTGTISAERASLIRELPIDRFEYLPF